MDKRTFFPRFLIFALFFASALEIKAEDWIILPRVTTGIMQYQYEVGTAGSTSDIRDKVELDEYLPFLGLGITFASPRDKIFLSTYFQATMTEDIDEPGTFATTRNTKLDRQDGFVSVGLQNLVGGLSASVGYKYGNTSYDWSEEDVNIGRVDKENDFITKGPFISFAYNLPIGKKGVLGLRVAYAGLDGETTTHRIHREGGGDKKVIARNRQEQVFSQTAGLNVGVSWNGRFTKKLSYGISLDGSKYNFEPKRGNFKDSLFSDTGHKIHDLAPYEAEETVYSISFLLRYRF